MAHYRVTLRDVLENHAHALRFGGREGIRSLDLVESAVGRPYSGYYRSIASKAAALAESLALNHGFIDGNKRTALLSVLLLIDRSGYRLQPVERPLNDEAEELILDIVEKRKTFDGIMAWFGARLRRQ